MQITLTRSTIGGTYTFEAASSLALSNHISGIGPTTGTNAIHFISTVLLFFFYENEQIEIFTTILKIFQSMCYNNLLTTK